MDTDSNLRDERLHAPYDIYDYDVIDANGRRIGPLTGFWVDDATNKPEFASVKTGWLLGKNHVIPVRDAQIDHGSRRILLPYDERLIRDAPGFAVDQDLAPEEEERVYQHYGLERSLLRSPTGLPRGPAASAALRGARERREERRETQTAEIPLHEERVEVGKRDVEEGVVRLRKVVRTEVRDVPVELRRERVDIERVPPGELRGPARARGPGAFQEEEITMTERREEPVLDRTREVVGGVRATKREEVERENVRTEVRREDVEVDRDEDLRRD